MITIIDKKKRLCLTRTYVGIFVGGDYLFREANSFPRAKLEKSKIEAIMFLSFKKFPNSGDLDLGNRTRYS